MDKPVQFRRLAQPVRRRSEAETLRAAARTAAEAFGVGAANPRALRMMDAAAGLLSCYLHLNGWLNGYGYRYGYGRYCVNYIWNAANELTDLIHRPLTLQSIGRAVRATAGAIGCLTGDLWRLGPYGNLLNLLRGLLGRLLTCLLSALSYTPGALGDAARDIQGIFGGYGGYGGYGGLGGYGGYGGRGYGSGLGGYGGYGGGGYGSAMSRGFQSIGRANREAQLISRMVGQRVGNVGAFAQNAIGLGYRLLDRRNRQRNAQSAVLEGASSPAVRESAVRYLKERERAADESLKAESIGGDTVYRVPDSMRESSLTEEVIGGDTVYRVPTQSASVKYLGESDFKAKEVANGVPEEVAEAGAKLGAEASKRKPAVGTAKGVASFASAQGMERDPCGGESPDRDAPLTAEEIDGEVVYRVPAEPSTPLAAESIGGDTVYRVPTGGTSARAAPAEGTAGGPVYRVPSSAMTENPLTAESIGGDTVYRVPSPYDEGPVAGGADPQAVFLEDECGLDGEETAGQPPSSGLEKAARAALAGVRSALVEVGTALACVVDRMPLGSGVPMPELGAERMAGEMRRWHRALSEDSDDPEEVERIVASENARADRIVYDMRNHQPDWGSNVTLAPDMDSEEAVAARENLAALQEQGPGGGGLAEDLAAANAAAAREAEAKC